MLMVVTYSCLLTAVILSLFIKNITVLFCITVLASIAAIYANIVTITGIMMIISFSTITWLYFYNRDRIKLVRFGLFLMMTTYSILFMQHLLPGFSNFLVLNKVQLSLLSCPFSMYLNFDKTVMALILYICSPLLINEKSLNLISLQQSLKSFVICISIVIPLALLSKYLVWDFKVSEYLVLWAVNNLFFVCFAEEVFFRGIIQNHLIALSSRYCSRLPKIIPIIIASLLFGVAHIKGGLFYVIFATICGLFYGYTYYITKRLTAAMIVHFTLNLSHFIFFSYPAHSSMCFNMATII